MARRKKEPDLGLDFLAEFEKQQEAKNLELITEGVTLHEPSSIGDEGEAAWLKLQGATPLEFLAMIYKNPWQDTKDRISAAKAILEFCHRKLPQKIEVDGTMNDTRKITAEGLSKLSDTELEQFTKLLEKLG